MPVMPLNEGMYRFVAKFFWDGGDDETARNRLMPLFDKLPDGIHKDSLHGFYLTGEREIIFIGQTKSGKALQEFCTSVIYDTHINAEFYHCIEVHEMKDLYEKRPTF